MSAALISRNADLRRLRDEGYNVSIRGDYLVVAEVPYVTSAKQVRLGVIASALELAGDATKPPTDHQVLFAGDTPCHMNGSPMTEIISSNVDVQITPGLHAKFSFSQKPTRGHYLDYFEKMSTYATILAAQAACVDPAADARVHRVWESNGEESPFRYLDAASARAGINFQTSKLALPSLAIAGLGGTGSYVLDLVAKTPVAKIHLIDGDVFSTHNAFRAPGAPSMEELREQPFKVDYLKAIYSKLHSGVVTHPEFIDASNADRLLAGHSFVFLCIDDPARKSVILDHLEASGTSFIDVGMDVIAKGGRLGGLLSVVSSTPEQRAGRRRISVGGGGQAAEYDSNIQIADLNSLNAALAVVKWKKMIGFYADSVGENFSSYSINSHVLVSSDS